MNNIDTSTIVGKIAVMQAAAAGSNIEVATRHGSALGTWNRAYEPSWNWVTSDYRIQKLGDDEIIILSFTGDSDKESRTIPFYSYESANKHAALLRSEGHAVKYLTYKRVKVTIPWQDKMGVR